MMKQWYLIYTKPKKEQVALQNLVAQGYEAQLPMFKSEKIIRHKKSVEEEPLFPRYCFIRLDEQGSQSWSPIRSTIGVSHMVKMGSVYPCIPEEAMKLILGVDSDNTIVESINSGDLVRINKGPFKAMEALFSHFDGDERAVLLLNILEKTVKGKFNLSEFSLVK